MSKFDRNGENPGNKLNPRKILEQKNEILEHRDPVRGSDKKTQLYIQKWKNFRNPRRILRTETKRICGCINLFRLRPQVRFLIH